MKIKSILIVFIISLAACRSGSEDAMTSLKAMQKGDPMVFRSEEKLISFVNDTDNGFVKTKVVNGIDYSAVLKPMAYLLAKKRLDDENPNLQATDFENLQYFDLRIKIENFHKEFIKHKLESQQQYQERVSYCAFKMQDDIKLIDGEDTLDCLLFHYERAFDVVPYGHFTLGFEPKPSTKVNVKTLVYYDRLFNNGLIKFTFSPEALVREPIL